MPGPATTCLCDSTGPAGADSEEESSLAIPAVATYYLPLGSRLEGQPVRARIRAEGSESMVPIIPLSVLYLGTVWLGPVPFFGTFFGNGLVCDFEQFQVSARPLL